MQLSWQSTYISGCCIAVSLFLHGCGDGKVGNGRCTQPKFQLVSQSISGKFHGKAEGNARIQLNDANFVPADLDLSVDLKLDMENLDIRMDGSGQQTINGRTRQGTLTYIGQPMAGRGSTIADGKCATTKIQPPGEKPPIKQLADKILAKALTCSGSDGADDIWTGTPQSFSAAAEEVMEEGKAGVSPRLLQSIHEHLYEQLFHPVQRRLQQQQGFPTMPGGPPMGSSTFVIRSDPALLIKGISINTVLQEDGQDVGSITLGLAFDKVAAGGPTAADMDISSFTCQEVPAYAPDAPAFAPEQTAPDGGQFSGPGTAGTPGRSGKGTTPTAKLYEVDESPPPAVQKMNDQTEGAELAAILPAIRAKIAQAESAGDFVDGMFPNFFGKGTEVEPVDTDIDHPVVNHAVCALDGARAVDDMLDSAIYIWASVKRCAKTSAVGNQVLCAMDVSAAVESIEAMINVVLKSIEKCGGLQDRHAQCGMAANVLIKNFASVATASAGVTAKCPNKLNGNQQIVGNNLLAQASTQATNQAKCMVDVKDVTKSLFKAAGRLTTIKDHCYGFDNYECAHNALKVMASFAAIGEYMAGAISRCNVAPHAKTKMEVDSECGAQALHLTRALTRLSSAGIEMSKSCGEGEARLYAMEHADVNDATQNASNLMSFVLAAFLPLAAFAGFVVGRRFAYVQQAEDCELESILED